MIVKLCKRSGTIEPIKATRKVHEQQPLKLQKRSGRRMNVTANRLKATGKVHEQQPLKLQKRSGRRMIVKLHKRSGAIEPVKATRKVPRAAAVKLHKRSVWRTIDSAIKKV